jgi:hypothetical protein
VTLTTSAREDPLHTSDYPIAVTATFTEDMDGATFTADDFTVSFLGDAKRSRWVTLRARWVTL